MFRLAVPSEKQASLPGQLGEEPLDAEGRRGLLAEGHGGRLRRARPVLLRAIKGERPPGTPLSPKAVPPNPFNTQPRRATASARLPLRPSARRSSAALCVNGFSATVHDR